MLAAFSFATYTSVVHPIQSGDRLVLYAHSSSEATNIYREKFGCQHLH